ncbi:MAG: toll/interleukin-1 receptor domain-containing protein, partial [Clostridia bacterium]|nr:toll/interleukin-1 receptor domain-containing protein [Clostridia bacterium]
MYEKVQCNVCGYNALERRQDGFYICPACGQIYERKEVEGDIEHSIELWNAFDRLRKNDFDEAHDLFTSVLAKDKRSHRAFFGRALADNAISFLENSTGKKVPICHNISENSFCQNEDYLNAIKNAPTEIVDGYKSMVMHIEAIRKEWIEKARKEKPYDVFICYKDKEEDGTTRTKDSYDISELCSELEKQNLNVFCARKSLVDKISEQYEPYIYNALKTSPVMIVYGSNPDYFRSAWVKNEWNRFLKLIELKQKDEKSLIIVYNGVNVSDLPEKLRIRQCMDKNSLTFFNDLMRHIGKLVYKNSYDAAVLPKIEIKRQTFQPKNTIIANGNVPTKQFATESTANENVTGDNRLINVRRFIENELKEEAISVIRDLLSENPHNYKALYYQFLVENDLWGSKPVIESDLKKIKSYETIDRILSCCSLKFAYAFLDKLYKLALRLAKERSNMAVELLKRILPYEYTVPTKEYSAKNEYLRQLFEIAIH